MNRENLKKEIGNLLLAVYNESGAINSEMADDILAIVFNDKIRVGMIGKARNEGKKYIYGELEQITSEDNPRLFRVGQHWYAVFHPTPFLSWDILHQMEDQANGKS